ncbi:hypothetical protein LPJ63_001222 [Coemansia sp. RSA 2711]|nr:hypothetical protein LPJ63_001222 [Coemansia sp. RSA 2711]KAJ1848173.1 hypothetical protein LPJ70_001155 [Coemansia sp. RSA 2708]KAJ2306898.1 hypothetical protein IWW54_004580 [Coemansia sp. RSA 2705]KAJ2313844.1 hypothetical protein IWW52_004455 [Coemansia sp. RSA 2704]
MKAVALALCLLASTHALVERIIGGARVPDGTYPFAVRLTITTASDNLLCGGALVDRGLVVTAAHCMVDTTNNAVFAPSEVSVCYGASSITKQSCTTARNVTVHPDYDPLTLSNDIAAIQISPLTLSANVATVPVYAGKLPAGTNLTTMGWGKTESDSSSSLPASLMSVGIEIGDANTCQQAQPSYKSADGPEVCSVNALTPGKDSCQGDSGSPTVVDDNGVVYLAALTSSGVDLADPGAVDCATKDGLAFYTHVYHFIDFVAAAANRSASDLTSPDDRNSDDDLTSAAPPAPAAALLLAALLALLIQ